MKYIIIIIIIIIIIHIKKKANENISLGADGYKEFSIVYNNPKPEFVRIKTSVDEHGKVDYSNFGQIIGIMKRLAFEGFDGEFKKYLYLLCLLRLCFIHIFNFIFTYIYYYYSILQEKNDEHEDEQVGKQVGEQTERIPIDFRFKKELHKLLLSKYDIELYIEKAIQFIESAHFWAKLRPVGKGLGLVITEIIKEYLLTNKDLKTITLHAFDPGLGTELAEIMATYRDEKTVEHPPLVIRGFNMH